MPDPITTEGISLRCVLLKEDDSRIVTLFSADYGLISVIMKRIRKNDYQKRTLSTSLTKGEYVLLPGKKDLYRFSDGHVIDAHIPFRNDWKKLQASIAMGNAILSSQWQGKPARAIYQLFTSYLKALTKSYDEKLIELSFLLKLLKHEGFLPKLTHCQLCHENPITAFHQGEFTCNGCGQGQGIPLSEEDQQLFFILTEARTFSLFEDLSPSMELKNVTEELFNHHYKEHLSHAKAN